MLSKVRRRIVINSRRLLAHSLMLALVVLPLAVTAPVSVSNAASKAHPVLLQMAAKDPNQNVGIIVQKRVKDSSVEDMVVRLGGKVTRDLHIINGFAAQLPAKQVSKLAQAPGVRWVSLDAPVSKSDGGTTCASCISTGNLRTAYPLAVGANWVWNVSPYRQGQGVGVAVVDSGVTGSHPDFSAGTPIGATRIITSYIASSAATNPDDGLGHGTHIAGVIGGNGTASSGGRIGIAPKVNLLNVKISDDQGNVTSSDLVVGLQWVNDNKALYNIRVLNLSLNSTVLESYHTNPIDAAAEILWFNGIVVVASAGNNGTTGLYPPANDPFVITVGATNDRGTATLYDDTIAPFSAYGVTTDGFAKPDLVAPGTNITSTLAGIQAVLALEHPNNVEGNNYFRMSGTSMAAPMVVGAAALLLQDEPNLNPDQVKYRLKATAVRSRWLWPGYNQLQAGSGYLNIPGAVYGTTTSTSNTGIAASQLLWTGNNPLNWGSVNWGSVNWGSVNWGSVNWGSVNWGSVNWGSTFWNE